MLLAECPALPAGVKTKYGDMEENCIGMLSVQGGIITKQYISGAYEAQFPFSLLYRSSPTTSGEYIGREGVLGQVAAWMAGKRIVVEGTEHSRPDYPELTGGSITGILQKSNVFLAGRLEGGSVDYQVEMALTYRKKGR